MSARRTSPRKAGRLGLGSAVPLACSLLALLSGVARPLPAGPDEDACAQPAANCLAYATFDAVLSDGVTARAADDFTPLEAAALESLCVWGAYFPNFPADDLFTVTYYADEGGLPGAVVGGPFVQAEALVLEARTFTGDFIPAGGGSILEYRLSHPPVPLEAGTCVWVEVVNDAAGGSSWFWSFSDDRAGNGVALLDLTVDDPYEAGDGLDGGDLALCVDVPIDTGTCPGPEPRPTPAHCFAPSTANATQSNGAVARCADDLSLVEGGTVSSVGFWGAYTNDLITTDLISVRYLADAGGIPGPLVAGPFVQGADLELLARNPTGETVEGTTFTIYEFLVAHPPVALPAGTCAWIEVRNDAAAPATWFWSWSADAKANDFCFVNTTPARPYSPFDAEPGHDFAVCVDVELALETDDCAEQPIDVPGCGPGGTGPCCQPNGTVGCDDADCCNAVCLVDPFCCLVQWDAVCVQVALLSAPQACGCPDLPPATCCLPGGWCNTASFLSCHAAGGLYLPLFDCVDFMCTGPCVLDVNEDFAVGVPELVFMILQWGPCGQGDCLGADIAGGEGGGGDGVVDVEDLIALILAWGPCQG